MNRLAVSASLLALVAGCGDNHDPALCLGSTCVAVATSIFNADFTGSGTLDSVDISSRTPHVGLDATLDPDTTLKIVGEELFVLQRDSGALRIYDPKTFAVKTEIPLGSNDPMDPLAAGKAFPQDLWIADDGKIWVTLSGNDAAHSLAVVDRNTKALLYIGLPQDAADTDGKPEPAKIYSCNSKLYVALQSYSFGMDGKISYAKGRLAIVDPDTRTARGAIDLVGLNPSDIVQLGGDDCNNVVVATSAGLTTAPDGKGNLERIDLDAAASKGVLATDNVLGGRPTLLARAADDLLYVGLYFDPQPNGMGDVYLSSVKVIAFDPQKMIVRGDVTGKFGNVNFLRERNGNLFIGAGIYAGTEDPSKQPRGLYITPADGSMLTLPPIDLQLTPSAIALP